MLTSDFDFKLPEELIAQEPTPTREGSKLLVLRRPAGAVEHRYFPDFLGYLRPGDLLVLNNSKVIPARLRALNPKTGGRQEVFLLEETAPNQWWVLMKPAKRAPVGTELVLLNHSGKPAHISVTVQETNPEGHRRVYFSGTETLLQELETLGEMPLPPYIKRESGASSGADISRYQTVYAQERGSVAAPTAGLHFTDELLTKLRQMGVQTCQVTLHVGLGTFAPVKVGMVSDHVMHQERFHVTSATAEAINTAKREGRRVFAVGTTSVRVLETLAARHDGRVVEGESRTNIFIHPPYQFRIVDGLITNFHLPMSTLLMLVSSFAAPGELGGRELILAAYAEAIRQRYRFFSYGDAMLIV